MKKFALLTALMLCLGSFTACGDTGSDGSDSKSSSKSSPDYEMNDDSDDNVSKKDEKTTDEPETEEKTTAEPETEDKNGPAVTDDDDVSYMKGTVKNGSYISPSANFAFDAGSDWYFASEEEILQMMGIASNSVNSGVDIEELIENQTVIYDAHAIETDGVRNIIFMFENVRKEGADPDTLSSEAFLDILKVNLNMVSSMNYSGFTDIDSFKLGSDEYKYFTVTSDTGVTIYQTYAGKMLGDYFYGIVYTSDKNDFSSILSSFRTAF